MYKTVTQSNDGATLNIKESTYLKDPAKYADFDLPREKLEYALAEALKKIDGVLRVRIIK